MRVGDRLLPEPPRQLISYMPRAPTRPVDGTHGVDLRQRRGNRRRRTRWWSINRGTRRRHRKRPCAGDPQGRRPASIDQTEPASARRIKLPDERNGLLMVFRTFDRVSYALILEITARVKVGDRLVNPR